MLVAQLMRRDPRTCSREDTLHAAAHLMWDHDLGALPVLGDGRVVGMLTDRDVAMAAFTQGRPLHEMVVASAMSRDLFTCHPGDGVREAMRIMREHQVRRLPVVDAEGRLHGVISVNDLTREARPRGKVSGQDLIEALTAIGNPRAPEAAPDAPASAPPAEQERPTLAVPG